ncbi:MAG: EAL domain-containing protein [Thermoanaerobaculia bacterium]|nr:EAL domain-containing protein [Thermoanaerobaculia bacterium]
MKPTHRLLDRVLAPGGLRSVYQPIFDLSESNPRVCAVECLTRGPVGSNIETADLLFSYARYMHAEHLVDRAAIEAALLGASELEGLGLHINVNAATLARDEKFPEFLTAACAICGIDAERVIVEIVEHTMIVDRTRFLESLRKLRQRGFTIALDDVGLGNSNFLMFYLTQPRVLKVDRFFVDGVNGDPVRRAVLVAVQRLAAEFDGYVVAEGVEREEDLATLRELGILEVQGFHLSRPLPQNQLAALLEGCGTSSGHRGALPTSSTT